jgi:hypothetical protein
VHTAALGPSFIQIGVQEEILLNSKSRNFCDFLFEIHFESGEVFMENVVHLFVICKTIFYLNFFELGKVHFEIVKFE